MTEGEDDGESGAFVECVEREEESTSSEEEEEEKEEKEDVAHSRLLSAITRLDNQKRRQRSEVMPTVSQFHLRPGGLYRALPGIVCE